MLVMINADIPSTADRYCCYIHCYCCCYFRCLYNQQTIGTDCTDLAEPVRARTSMEVEERIHRRGEIQELGLVYHFEVVEAEECRNMCAVLQVRVCCHTLIHNWQTDHKLELAKGAS